MPSLAVSPHKSRCYDMTKLPCSGIWSRQRFFIGSTGRNRNPESALSLLTSSCLLANRSIQYCIARCTHHIEHLCTGVPGTAVCLPLSLHPLSLALGILPIIGGYRFIPTKYIQKNSMRPVIAQSTADFKNQNVINWRAR